MADLSRIGWTRVFWILLGALAILWHPGFSLNDEFGQTLGLHALSEGHYLISGDQVPQGYRDIETHSHTHWGIPGPDQGPSKPIGSDFLNVMALPMHFLLSTLASTFGVLPALGLVGSLAIGAGLVALSGERWLGVAGAAISWVTSWGAPDVAAEPFVQLAAIQATNALLAALAGALFWQMHRERSETQAWLVAAFFLFATPVLFWTLNTKYHGAAVALTAIAAWAYRGGHRSDWKHTALAFAVAGLIISVHPPSGVAVLGSMGIMAVPAIRLGWSIFFQRSLAGAGGLAVGLLPEVLLRGLRASAGATERYVRSEGSVGAEVERQFASGYLRRAGILEPLDGAEAVLRMFAWTDWRVGETGPAIPFLSLVPLLLLLVLAWPKTGFYGRWAAFHVIVLWLLVGTGLYANGSGFDLRHGATLWPLVALALVPHLERAWKSRQRNVAFALVACTWTLVLTALFLVRSVRGDLVFLMGPNFEFTQPVKFGGVVVAGVLFLVSIVPRLRVWRWTAAAAALGWSFTIQLLLQFGPARSSNQAVSTPFVYQPMEWLGQAVRWFLIGS